MRPFLDCWIIGLNGELACKKSNDPFRTWMNEYRRTGAVVEMEQPDDVPLSERGQKRIEPSVHDLIERTFGQVRIKLAPKGERPK
jgi:hypothetical protein